MPESAGAVWIDEGGEDKRHLNPLMRAAKTGRLALVTALVDEHGADVNAVADRSLYTALIVAAYEGHEAVVRFLLSRGADVRSVNKFGESAEAVAVSRRHASLAALLRAASAATDAGVGGAGAEVGAGAGAGVAGAGAGAAGAVAGAGEGEGASAASKPR
jgi:hypothetical protein